MPNKLAQEKSPYLLQHAKNPVDWYPWTDEAFVKAAAEDKPIFLSIGYSTCHWCHVMEHESFEDMEVADLLNDTFVCIKVDREERPDIDALYMTACSMMTGSGGWPLTIIMTPDRKPFFAGTYFAKHSGFGKIGMLDMVARIREIWENRRGEVERSADNILELLQQNRSLGGADLDEKILHAAFTELSRRYDSVNGGFSRAPKFPTPHITTFLLRYWKMTGNEQVIAMINNTLTSMRLGGIYDHIGFGFHRYSTDEKWLLPHFEKMLYDQALQAAAYAEAYQVTGTTLFKQTAQEIFTYVLRDMTAPEGGFYSAEDADSEGVEGKFYVWSISELQQALTPQELERILKMYNLRREGNFHDEATGAQSGANIFHLSRPLTDDAVDDTGINLDTRDGLEAIRKKLFNVRKKRIHPLKDDKILTDWNGLMIGALAIGARIFRNKQYLQAAIRAADFILSCLCDRNGRLLHRYRDGDSAITGMLCDYAFLVWGLLELYAADLDPNILSKAQLLNDRMLDLFWDEKEGGFFQTPIDEEPLLVRSKEIYDGALPSGNSIALSNLLHLERLTANPELGRMAKFLIRAFSETLKEIPSAYTQFLTGLYLALRPATEIVVVGDIQAHDTRKMLATIREKFSPEVTVLFKDSSAPAENLAMIAPFTSQYTALDGKATAYVCRGNSCDSPTNDLECLQNILEQ